METINLKCRKCRQVLLRHPDSVILTVHGAPFNSVKNNSNDMDNNCRKQKLDVYYIQEIGIPDWISKAIDNADWVRGKLKCPSCFARLGSFDFVSGFKCPCEKQQVVPPIHIVKSKVDVCSLENISDKLTESSDNSVR